MGNKNPPKWYVDKEWNNPQRQQTRMLTQKAVEEYHANGEIVDYDDMPTNLQHRHGAGWNWY